MTWLVLHAIAYLSLINGSEISDKASEYSQTLCAGVKDLDRVDSTNAEIIHLFVGSENYIERVCMLFNWGIAIFQVLYDTTCGDLTACLQHYQPAITQALLRTGTWLLDV